MCSIQEAWGDFTPDNNKTQTLVQNTKQQQLQMNSNMGRQMVDPGGNPPDIVGNVVMQDDDHIQYSRPAQDYNYTDMHQHWNKKADPSMNGMTRGVHNKYSRDKRIDIKQHNTPYGTLETDVDMNYYITNDAKTPDYLDIYKKDSPNIPGLGSLARLEHPMASNASNDSYMDITDNYYSNEQSKTDNEFTPEIITDPKLLALARNNTQNTKDTKKDNSNVNKNVVPDDIRKLQEEIKYLMTKIEVLEGKVKNVENTTNHDIILFVVIAIFILFVIDNVFKFNKLS
jgi:hypothetical protein